MAFRAAALLLAIGAVAGCGSEGKVDEANSYVRAVNAAEKRFGNTVTELTETIDSRSTVTQYRRAVTAYDRALQEVLAALRRIHPPDRVRALHGRLVGLVDRIGQQVEEARSLISTTREPTKVLDVQSRLAKIADDAPREINALHDAIDRELGK